jgi:hypothetical protein
MRAVRFLLPLLSLFLSASLWAQQPNLEPDTPHDKPLPTVSFDFVLPGTRPAHFAVSVESSGRTAYRSDEVAPVAGNESETGEPYLLRFVMSEPTRTRIFELTSQANFFKGDFNYTKSRVANTGTKTLTYGEGPSVAFGGPTNGVRNSTTYNYSENPAIQQLTTIFQSISNTIELGARLDFLRRFDRLGLDAELKRADELAKENNYIELHVIAPTLRAISEDYRVINVARQRAKNLLSMAEQTSSTAQR